MPYLLGVSFLWAFSFGLIKGNLAGVDANLAAAARMLLALAVLLPVFRPHVLKDARLSAALFLTGAVQYGVMYLCYMGSFQFLHAHEVVLFTCSTPIYVVLLDDLEQRRLQPVFLLTAMLAAAGTALAMYRDLDRNGLLKGFVLVQVSNLCFAFGQIRYRQLMAGRAWRDRDVFALLFLGAFVAALVPAAISTRTAPGGGLVDAVSRLTPTQAWTLLYLGVLASGIGFFLWNFGARRANPGTLAVLNNAKLPLGVACSLCFFHEQAGSLPRLLAGGGILLAALVVSERHARLPRKAGEAESCTEPRRS